MVLIGVALLIKWTDIEILYIIIENYIWLIFILFVLILPLLLKLSIVQKIIWIISNYIFSLLYFLGIYLIIVMLHSFDHLLTKMVCTVALAAWVLTAGAGLILQGLDESRGGVRPAADRGRNDAGVLDICVAGYQR